MDFEKCSDCKYCKPKKQNIGYCIINKMGTLLDSSACHNGVYGKYNELYKVTVTKKITETYLVKAESSKEAKNIVENKKAEKISKKTIYNRIKITKE